MSRSSLHCAGAIFSIRRTLQDYKIKSPPETLFYNISARDLLDMLNLTMEAWDALEHIEKETASLISGLLDAVKNNG